MSDADKLSKDNALALNCFAVAISQGNNNGAKRFREELHMILDLQLNALMKWMKENSDN